MVDSPMLAICLIRCVMSDEESMVEKLKILSLKTSLEGGGIISVIRTATGNQVLEKP